MITLITRKPAVPNGARHGLGLLLGLLFLGACEARQQSASVPYAPVPVAAGASMKPEPGTIRSGDLMLYGAKTVVVFYKTFTSPYSYSTIGRVADPAGLAQALGQHGAQVEFIQYK